MEQAAENRRPREVRAGPVTALLDGAFLRRIKVGPHELLRGVYAAVRDQNWGTVEPTFGRYELDEAADSFRLRFTAEHRQGEVDFVWDGEYVGEPSGRIVFRFDGVARSAFRKNRIGFCVLHPPELAGTPYVRETPAGPIGERFPEQISPRRDISDMAALRYAVGPVGVELRFEGDLFDMEDQRNWTDASYKTFCTPLARPYPVQMAAGQRISQTVTLDLRVPSGVGAAAAGDAGPDVVVADRVVGRLPPIGLGAAYDGRPLGSAALERLRALRPVHLRVELDLREPDGGAGTTWRDVLRAASQDAAALGAALDLALLTDAAGTGLEAATAEIAALPVPVVRVAPFAEKVWVTTAPLIARARAAGFAAPVGGGSRTDFAQLNMQQALIPFDALDFAAYAVNPQVHAFDDLSIVETIGAQAATVASARALADSLPDSRRDRPIVVGPITLLPRFNPNATVREPPPPPGAPPPHADPRQTTPFAAAWTVGSVHRLAAGGAAALTYFETAGPAGVVDAAGDPHPVHDVLAALTPHAGAELLDVTLADPLAAEAIAIRRDGGLLVLVANLTAEPRQLAVALPSGEVHSLDLGPYATARIDSGSDGPG
jgi:hypothetical protein